MQNCANSLKRLEKLEQETILYYFDTISLSKNKQNYLISLYDSMFFHLLKGDYDDSFLSESLTDLEENEKRNLFELARKYSHLIFYGGNSRCWIDSVEGVTLQDTDLICLKILDNYDFLLKIAREGGEIVLRQLSFFQKSVMSKEGSVLDYLRNTFYNDNDLIKFLIELSKKDGIYSHLTNLEKVQVCLYLRNSKKGEDFSSFEFEKQIDTILSMNSDIEQNSSEIQDLIPQYLNINYNF